MSRKLRKLIDRSDRTADMRARASRRGLEPGQLSPREQAFVDALAAGAKSMREAYEKATGTRGPAAQVGGSRMLRRPEVTAALVEEARRLRAAGALVGMRELVRLTRHAKSEYVRGDSAKYLSSAEGLGPRADAPPAFGAKFTINIDLSEPGKPAQPGEITHAEISPAPQIEHGPAVGGSEPR